MENGNTVDLVNSLGGQCDFFDCNEPANERIAWCSRFGKLTVADACLRHAQELREELKMLLGAGTATWTSIPPDGDIAQRFPKWCSRCGFVRVSGIAICERCALQDQYDQSISRGESESVLEAQDAEFMRMDGELLMCGRTERPFHRRFELIDKMMREDWAKRPASIAKWAREGPVSVEEMRAL